MWDLKKYKEKTAMIDEQGRRILYEELYDIGKEISVVIPKRVLVMQLCRNSIGSVAGYVAFLNHGIVPMLLGAGLERELRARLVDLYAPAFIWLPTDMLGSLENKTDGLAGFFPVYEQFDYTLVKTGYAKEYPLHDDLALLLTTSGSTGSPKFVRQSYRNISANAASIVQYLHLDETERPITTLPMNYTYGLSIINSHLLVGATILLTKKGPMQKDFWTFFKEQEATSFGGVPYTYEMLERLRFFRMDLPSLRYFTQAGGKLAPELHRKFAEYAAERGKKFVVMYGQTEATARMGYLPPERALDKCGSMGIAIPGGRMWLRDVDGSRITQPGKVGELIYEGPNVTLGYAGCGAGLAKGDERHGILETGDMAKCDEDGYFYIVGRKKRFLKVFGNRLNLDELDGMIKSRFAGLDCASSGKDDHVEIYVTAAGRAHEIRSFVAEKTGLHMRAFSVYAVREIPKSDAGKVLYGELELVSVLKEAAFKMMTFSGTTGSVFRK